MQNMLRSTDYIFFLFQISKYLMIMTLCSCVTKKAGPSFITNISSEASLVGNKHQKLNK